MVPADPLQARTRPIVLVADPSHSSTALVEMKFKAAGFAVRIARDSLAAMQVIQTEPVAAALIDVHLEPQSGFFMVEQIKALGRPMAIFMTEANPNEETVNHAFDLGVDDFVNKPFFPEVVIEKLKRLLYAAPTGEPEDVLELVEVVEEEPATEWDPALSADATPDDDWLIRSGPEPSGHPQATSLQDLGQIPNVAVPPDELEIPLEVALPAEIELPEDAIQPLSDSMAGVVATDAGMVAGSLEGRKALTLFRAVATKRRTGLLSLRRGDTKGLVYFEEGQIFQAILGSLPAEESFLELATWTDCVFKFEPGVTISRRVIRAPTAMLFEAAARVV